MAHVLSNNHAIKRLVDTHGDKISMNNIISQLNAPVTALFEHHLTSTEGRYMPLARAFSRLHPDDHKTLLDNIGETGDLVRKHIRPEHINWLLDNTTGYGMELQSNRQKAFDKLITDLKSVNFPHIH
jgi:hypothetical protein